MTDSQNTDHQVGKRGQVDICCGTPELGVPEIYPGANHIRGKETTVTETNDLLHSAAYKHHLTLISNHLEITRSNK